MDLRKAVYNASKNGKLHKLRSLLTGKTRVEILDILATPHNGTTPIIMSCKNGHTSIVKYIVDQCGVDPEQSASVTFDGETIEGAPPLWCAAAAGHLNIVKFLVERGCNVNKTTLSNSTPLRAACFDGHFDIVSHLVKNSADIEIANRHGHTCLMISCYKGHKNIVKLLIDSGADVNRKSSKGNTALHDCAESGCLEIMILLLRSSAKMERDALGLTPLLTAALSGFSHIVVYLTSGDFSGQCSREEKITALELLGATFIDKRRDMVTAIQYWGKAMEMREEDVPLPKTGLSEAKAAYDFIVEVTNQKQLSQSLSDPDELRMQALLVRERILGHGHPDTSYYIRYRGALYADMGNYERCLKLWMYALDMQQEVLRPLNPMTQSSFLSFAELFLFITTDRSASVQVCELKFKDIFTVLMKAIAELDRSKECVGEHCDEFSSDSCTDVHRYRLISIILHLLSIICIYPVMTPEDDHRFKKAVYLWLKLGYISERGATPLHLACSKKTTSIGKHPVCLFPCLSLVKLLCELGCDVNAVDFDGNTPLHLVAGEYHAQMPINLSLLSEGAHIDQVNNDNKTPLQMIEKSIMVSGGTLNQLCFVNLQCLASRVIKKSQIEYIGCVPKSLEKFIEKH